MHHAGLLLLLSYCTPPALSHSFVSVRHLLLCLLSAHAAPFKLIRALSPLFRDAAKAEQEASGVASPRSIINISSTSGTHGNSGQVGGPQGICTFLARSLRKPGWIHCYVIEVHVFLEVHVD
jgi:hypothetical protein